MIDFERALLLLNVYHKAGDFNWLQTAARNELRTMAPAPVQLWSKPEVTEVLKSPSSLADRPVRPSGQPAQRASDIER